MRPSAVRQLQPLVSTRTGAGSDMHVVRSESALSALPEISSLSVSGSSRKADMVAVGKAWSGGTVAAVGSFDGKMLDDSHKAAVPAAVQEVKLLTGTHEEVVECEAPLVGTVPQVQAAFELGKGVLGSRHGDSKSPMSSTLNTKASSAADSQQSSCAPFTIRAIIVCLQLSHFGAVEACLRLLDVHGSNLLGHTVLRHDLSHGSFDAEYVPARVVASLALVLHGIGLPVAGVWFLRRNQHKLDRPRFQHAAGFLYSGYRRWEGGMGGFWYWELLVVTLRKVLLLIVAVTVSQPFLQSALIMIVLTLSLLLQVRAQPYTSSLMNGLDMAGMGSLAVLALLGLSQADVVVKGSGSLTAGLASVLSVLVSGSFLLFFGVVVGAIFWRTLA